MSGPLLLVPFFDVSPILDSKTRPKRAIRAREHVKTNKPAFSD